jgi:hypothetical protein
MTSPSVAKNKRTTQVPCQDIAKPSRTQSTLSAMALAKDEVAKAVGAAKSKIDEAGTIANVSSRLAVL